MKFSNRARNLKGSATMGASLRAQELKSQGENVLLASIGEPDNDVSPDIKSALITHVRENVSRYGSAQGLWSTRKALASWFRKVYGANYNVEQIVVTPGSKFALFALMQILCEAGDEVLIPVPYWVSYRTLAEMAGATPRFCQPNADYKLSPEILRQNLNPNSRILILNSPNNPTGAVYSKAELENLYEVLQSHPDVTVLCDDIYNQLIFKSSDRAPSLLDVADDEFKKRIIVIHGVSKSHAMTGWRMGWVAGESECMTKLTQFMSQTMTCIPDFIQKAAETALIGGDASVENLRQLIKTRQSWIQKELASVSSIKLYPSEGAFYLWIALKNNPENSEQISERLLLEKGVASVPGEAFGMPGHIRLSTTISFENLQDLAQRLKDFFGP